MKINKKYYKVTRIFVPSVILRKYDLEYDLLCKRGDFYKCTSYEKSTGSIAVYLSNSYEILDKVEWSFKSRNNA